ncbi:hypothetical protein GJR88_03424 [Dietzia sp. DQ12-45-1b]|nr:hypothetical protein GJR88_03424 [Dietzia sp. DQ12-45-1b]
MDAYSQAKLVTLNDNSGRLFDLRRRMDKSVVVANTDLYDDVLGTPFGKQGSDDRVARG